MSLPCRLGCWLTLIVAPPLTANGLLDEMRIVTGASLGYSHIAFPEKLDHDMSFISLSVPVALTFQKWQLAANLQTTLSEADLSEEEDTGKASRDDIDIMLGYQLNQQWTVFGGYKYGETEMQFIPRDIEDEEELATVTNESYQQQGPFLGVSYRWLFEKAGSLSVSLAYARLSSTNNFAANTDDEEIDEELEFDDLTGRVTGDTHGFSYSLSWTMPISSNLLFQTRFKVNDYQQDIEAQGNRYADIDETFTSLHVGLAYVF